MKMRHAILGAGGVGGLVGALLARAGHDVTVIVRAASLAGYPKEIALESPLGSFSAPVARASTVREPFDALWIAVKATHLDEALDEVEDASRIRAVVPLLNGVDHVPLLRARFGHERVIAATISVESERKAPGKIVHLSPFVDLRVSARGAPLLSEAIEALARAGVSTRFVADEATLLWSKLVFLAPLALTTSAAGVAIGGVARDPAWKARLERAAREACAVASAEGAHVDPDRIVESLASLPPSLRSSMLKDLIAGNPPELDAIAGPIVRGGARHGIDVSVTRDLVERVRAIVSARRGA